MRPEYFDACQIYLPLQGISLSFEMLAAGKRVILRLCAKFFDGAGSLLQVLPWPAPLLAVLRLAQQTMLRCGPERDARSWRLQMIGKLAAATGRVAGSALFSWLVASFGSCNETCGSPGPAFGFMRWPQLPPVIGLAGAASEAGR